MTVHKISIVECDGCGTTALSPTMILLDLIHVVGRPAHAGEARSAAHAKRWIHTAKGKDLCGNCRPVPGAAPKVHTLNPFHWGH